MDDTPTPRPDRSRIVDTLRASAADTVNIEAMSRAAFVAQVIRRDIVSRGWPVGEVLGSEQELLARLKVSRGVLRQAIRLLESGSVATMRRGPGGGLTVTAPRSEAVADSVALFLEYERVEPTDVLAVRFLLELRTVELAAEHLEEAGVLALRALLDAEADPTTRADPSRWVDFHTLVADLSGSRTMALFVRVLVALTRDIPRHRDLGDPEMDLAHSEHQQIADAIISGDGALARNLAYHHLSRMRSVLCS